MRRSGLRISRFLKGPWLAGLGLYVLVALASAAWTYHTAIQTPGTAAELNALYERMAQEDFPEVATVDAADLLGSAMDGSVVFVDVREPEEQEVSMLPGAVAAEDVFCCPEKWRESRLVVYCTVSYRSGLMAKRMAEQGFKLENLRGGIQGWLHAGGKIYDARGETMRVHVYGPFWNYAPEAYITVW